MPLVSPRIQTRFSPSNVASELFFPTFLTPYKHRWKIYADTSALTTTETDFPAAFFAPSLAGKIKALTAGLPNYNDAIFTRTDGHTVLPFYWESKPTTGVGAVGHFKVPSLVHGNSAFHVGYLYTGNASATDQSNEAGVFPTSQFAARYSMSEATDATVYDSTTNSNDGTPTGSPVGGATGQIGSGIQFDGTGDKIDCEAGASLDLPLPLSMSVWCNPESTTELGYLIDHSNNGTTGYSLDWQILTADKVRVRLNAHYVESDAVFSDAGALVHVAASVGADRLVTFYRNGVAAGSGTPAAYAPGSGVQLCIGNRTGGTSTATRFAGIIDEVRVYNVACSASNVLAQYLSGMGTLLTVGAEEII